VEVLDMTIRFDGRVAIVTGAGGGLGRAYARTLAARGARVVVNDIGGAVDGSGASKGPAQDVVDEIVAAGGAAIANTDSVAERDSAAAIVAAAVDAWGKVDIVINNAGIVRDKAFHNMTLDDFEFVVRVHLLGSAYVSHAAFPIMRANNYGRILMATSSTGLYGNFGQANYGAAKAGMVGLVHTLKIEGARFNINVNAIAPLALTRMSETAPIFDGADAAPDQVAAMAGYLVSEDCTATGGIFAATAGYYSSVRFVEGKGVRLDKAVPATPDTIAENFAAITDLSDAAPWDDVTSHLKYALRLG
jgi:NAD(P)-dependent dehydrogenase (short-subunit alcohol dehydrogenase family)